MQFLQFLEALLTFVENFISLILLLFCQYLQCVKQKCIHVWISAIWMGRVANALLEAYLSIYLFYLFLVKVSPFLILCRFYKIQMFILVVILQALHVPYKENCSVISRYYRHTEYCWSHILCVKKDSFTPLCLCKFS